MQLRKLSADDVRVWEAKLAATGSKTGGPLSKAAVQGARRELSTALEVQHTARMLGRLYDAVECQGMASALVQQVGDEAGVPVFDGIATHDHPTARLAEQLEGGASSADNRRFVLQAVLLSTIG